MRRLGGSLLLAGSLAVAAAGSGHAADLVDTLAAAGQFGTLLKAAETAGVAAKLKGPGPFTLFAPTDAAFAALPPGVLDGLTAEPVELGKVLAYHLLAGRLASTDVAGEIDATTKSVAVNTLSNRPVTIAGGPAGAVMIDRATVTQADLQADNGIIHVIDAVLVPAKPIQPGM